VKHDARCTEHQNSNSIYTCALGTLFTQSTESTRINEQNMFHNHALKEYLNLYNKTNKCTCIKSCITYQLPTFFDRFAIIRVALQEY
jgi:hypothetical protein